MTKMTERQCNKLSRRAFTLVEVIISITLTASLMTVAYTFYFFTLRVSGPGIDKIEIQKKARMVIEHISGDLRSAKEIIRVEPGILELKRFVDDKTEQSHINLSGDTMTQHVIYEYKKKGSGNDDAIFVTIDNAESVMMHFKEIDGNIFEAYTYDPDDNLIPFDFRENDSIMRAKISLVKLKFKVSHNKNEVLLTTAVNPRFLYGFKQQPYWNFNK